MRLLLFVWAVGAGAAGYLIWVSLVAALRAILSPHPLNPARIERHRRLQATMWTVAGLVSGALAACTGAAFFDVVLTLVIVVALVGQLAMLAYVRSRVRRLNSSGPRADR